MDIIELYQVEKKDSRKTYYSITYNDTEKIHPHSSLDTLISFLNKESEDALITFPKEDRLLRLHDHTYELIGLSDADRLHVKENMTGHYRIKRY